MSYLRRAPSGRVTSFRSSNNRHIKSSERRSITTIAPKQRREILGASEITQLTAKEPREVERYLDDLAIEARSFNIKDYYAPFKQYGMDYWNWPEETRKQHEELDTRIQAVLMGHNTAALAYFDQLIAESVHFQIDAEDQFGVKALMTKFKTADAEANSQLVASSGEKPKKFPWEWFKSVSPVPSLVTALEEKDKLRKEKHQALLDSHEQQLLKLQDVNRAIAAVYDTQTANTIEELKVVMEGFQYEIDNWKDIEENLWDAWVEDITAKFPEVEDEVLDMINRDIWDPEGENDWSQKWWLNKDHHGQPITGDHHDDHGHGAKDAHADKGGKH